MKKCPNCNQAFSDDNDFCLNDGSPLIADHFTQPTVVTHMPSSSPTYLTPYSATVSTSNTSQYVMFGVILLLAVLAVGFGVAYFVSGKEETAKVEAVNENKNSAKEEEERRLEERRIQIDADANRVAADRKRLEDEKKKAAAEKRNSGPMPQSSTAWITDPPTNIRSSPNGAIQCKMQTRSAITILPSPPIPDNNGVWYYTNACGRQGLVHSTQVSFN